jgi:hypothetical protein
MFANAYCKKRISVFLQGKVVFVEDGDPAEALPSNFRTILLFLVVKFI